MQIILLSQLIKCIFCKECSLDSAKRDTNELVLADFNELKDLNFDCSISYLNLSILQFRPVKKLVLNSSLNLTGLVLTPIEREVSIKLLNFNGIDLTSNPFKSLKFINYSIERIFWIYMNSKFDFYSNSFLTSENCSLELIKSNKDNLFSNAILLAINNGILFSDRMCPYAFSNMKIGVLSITKLSSSFVLYNMLQFQNKSYNNSINSTIFHLDIFMYHCELNSKFLNSLVFTDLRVLDLNGQIHSIEAGLFKSFKRLKVLRLRIQYVKKLLIEKNDWLNSIDYDFYVDPISSETIARNSDFIKVLIVYQTYSQVTFYDYPNEDYCALKKFPHRRLLFPILLPNHKSSCTCTEIFLIQYSFLYSSSIFQANSLLFGHYYDLQYHLDAFESDAFYSHCINRSIFEIINKCNLYTRRINCSISTSKQNYDFTFYMYDWFILAKVNLYAFTLFVNPLFSLFALLANLLTIIAGSSKNSRKEFDKMYLYLKTCSLFNIGYVVLLCFQITATCIDESFFCSYFHASIYVQYLNLILVKIICNIFKSCSNITQISFTLSRYITISNTTSPILNRFQKVSFKKYLIIILLFSIMINIHNCFEYIIKRSTKASNQLQAFFVANYSAYYKSEVILSYKENYSYTEYLILNILKYINIIFSETFYILVSSIIDLFLFFFVRKKMKIKLDLAQAVVKPIFNLIIINGSNSARYLKELKLNKANASKNRITSMIILNGVNFLILRLPLALVSLYGFVFIYDKNEMKFKPNLIDYIVCRYYRFCESLEQILLFTYLNSYIVQFFILWKLDKNFRENFNDFKFSIRSKIYFLGQFTIRLFNLFGFIHLI